jgi:hypothetical protein
METRSSQQEAERDSCLCTQAERVQCKARRFSVKYKSASLPKISIEQTPFQTFRVVNDSQIIHHTPEIVQQVWASKGLILYNCVNTLILYCQMQL